MVNLIYDACEEYAFIIIMMSLALVYAMMCSLFSFYQIVSISHSSSGICASIFRVFSCLCADVGKLSRSWSITMLSSFYIYWLCQFICHIGITGGGLQRNWDLELQIRSLNLQRGYLLLMLKITMPGLIGRCASFFNSFFFHFDCFMELTLKIITISWISNKTTM